MIDAADAYISFFLDTASAVVRVETLEFLHPDFSQTYRVVRNYTEGVTVTHEDGIAYFHEYWPLRISGLGASNDLDVSIQIDLGDLGELLPRELERAMLNDGLAVKPMVKYRLYRSDMLKKPMAGPYLLEAKTISFNREGCSFEAQAMKLNNRATGELYDLDRFKPLRSFLY